MCPPALPARKGQVETGREAVCSREEGAFQDSGRRAPDLGTRLPDCEQVAACFFGRPVSGLRRQPNKLPYAQHSGPGKWLRYRTCDGAREDPSCQPAGLQCQPSRLLQALSQVAHYWAVC